MLIEGKLPSEFAREWYDAESIHKAIIRRSHAPGDLPPVPADVTSKEFAGWMANQYQLAMCKGMEIAERSLLAGISDPGAMLAEVRETLRGVVNALENGHAIKPGSAYADRLARLAGMGESP